VIVYKSSPYFIAAAALLMLLLLAWSWRDAARRGVSAAVVVIWLLALLFAATRVPSYVLDEIRVDDERMQWREGPWWSVAAGEIRFADVKSVRVERRTGGSGRLRRTQTLWVVESTHGTRETYVVFDLWMDHYLDVRAHFERRGIAITGDR
jgi:hypothetical protein